MELLKDKVALVTGGTRGIGYAIVRTFLEAKVVLCGSRPETAQKAVDELKKENAGFEVEGISPDLTSYESITKAVEEIKAKYGKIDILVNNAGISASEPLYSYDPKDFDKIMNLNVNYPRGGSDNERKRRRSYSEHLFHGIDLRTARRSGISHIKVCS